MRRGRATGPSRIRRVSAGLSPIRATALLAMLVTSGLIYGVSSADAFGLRHVDLPAVRYTSAITIRANLPVTDGSNLFSLTTDDLVDHLLELPAVAGASVEVALPDRLVVHLEERSPILVWQVGERRYLVDRAGLLFAIAGTEPGGTEPGGTAPSGTQPRGTPAAAASSGAVASASSQDPSLPLIVDHRLASEAALGIGDSLDPIVLDAATRLASLHPADIGSAASALAVEVSDENGFVVRASPQGWLAIFGFYTPTLRTTEMVPGQVRLLRSLLADREATVDRVILADETNGTYQPRPTAKPVATSRTATPRPAPTSRPAATSRPTATAGR